LRMRSSICPNRSWVVVGLALAAGLAGAQEPKLTRGAELLVPFKQGLQTALRTGLARGPVEAISACQLQAPEIARALSLGGIRVGRSSHRLRNPANAAPEWVAAILDGYVASPSDRSPRTVPLPNGQRGYVEPIRLQAACLTCHGEVLAADVASRIRELYPDDRAVGFRVGDLRGVFWVEFPATE
jgi:hypothetical protein